MQPIKSNLTINFSEPNYSLRWEEDRDRVVIPTVQHGPRYTVVSTNSRFVRLFVGQGVDPIVRAVTGSLKYEGTYTQKDVVEVLMITPESPSVNIPEWATNVRLAPLGSPLSKDGSPASGVRFSYAADKFAVVASAAVYGAVEVKYDAPYRLYLYDFVGACPLSPPAQNDEQGNAIDPVSPNYFTPGLIYAIDFTKQVSAHANLSPPTCEWNGNNFNSRDTAQARKIPTLTLEIDPEYPPKLVGTSDNLACEAAIRCYPAGAAVQQMATTGVLTKEQGVNTMEVVDSLVFMNSITETLKYIPLGSVEINTLRVFEAAAGFRGFVGPNDDVIDVDWSEDGLSYSNPRPRLTEATEVVAVGLFRHPMKVLATAEARYVTSFDRFRFRFEWDSNKREFKQAMVIAIDEEGRVGTISVNPPSMKSRNKRLT